MKIRKKHAMVLSFTLGILLLATTAYAEISTKNGYVQLKDALKYTAEKCTSELSSYTIDTYEVIKNNGNTVSSKHELTKYDVTNGTREEISKRVEGNTILEDSTTYYDKTCSISYNKESDTYNVSSFNNHRRDENITNPFEEEESKDMEKIVDALVGNLKDYIIVTDNIDETKKLSVNLSEAQIPALINAITSYNYKDEFSNSTVIYIGDQSNVMPSLTKDIYIQNITGVMNLDKDGLMQSVLATCIISGKDNKGIDHTLTFETQVKLTDINRTEVIKPDLKGKKISNYAEKVTYTLSDPQMYIGTYKNDIVIKKDGEFQKIGERFVDIISLDDKKIVGKYHEEYIKDYDNYSLKINDFEFTSDFSEYDNLHCSFNATDSINRRIEGFVYINPNYPNIDFTIDNIKDTNNNNYNSNYNRVLK